MIKFELLGPCPSQALESFASSFTEQLVAQFPLAAHAINGTAPQNDDIACRVAAATAEKMEYLDC